jgi:hypothetical protein
MVVYLRWTRIRRAVSAGVGTSVLEDPGGPCTFYPARLGVKTTDMSPDPMYLPSLAVGLLREKGHVIGGNVVSSNGVHRTVIDRVARTHREAVRLASQYPEWLDKDRQHLQARRAYQRSLASTSD